MIKVGLTGNIGSGKSTVAKIFGILNVPIFFADQEAKRVLASAEIIAQLESFLKTNITHQDGTVDRKKIASIVFKNPIALNYLNELIHPKVASTFHEWTKKQAGQPYILHEAAILYESEFDQLMDKVIYVNAPVNVRINRIMERDHLTKTSVLERMKNQWEDGKKIQLADFVIENGLNNLIIPQVLNTHQQLVDLSRLP